MEGRVEKAPGREVAISRDGTADQGQAELDGPLELEQDGRRSLFAEWTLVSFDGGSATFRARDGGMVTVLAAR